MIRLLYFSEASHYLLRTRDLVDTIWSEAVAYISKNLHHQKIYLMHGKKYYSKLHIKLVLQRFCFKQNTADQLKDVIGEAVIDDGDEVS